MSRSKQQAVDAKPVPARHRYVDPPDLDVRHLTFCAQVAWHEAEGTEREPDANDQQLMLALGAGWANAKLRIAALETIIELILPLAKGYAAAHPHTINRQCVEAAEESLRPTPARGEA